MSEVLRGAALEAVREAGLELRRQGWDVKATLEYVPERSTYAVTLRLELPEMLMPIAIEKALRR